MMRNEFNAADVARAAHHRGDGERVAELMNLHPLEMWFGLPTTELQLVLESARTQLAASSPIGNIVLQLVSGVRLGMPMTESPAGSNIAVFVDALMLRLQGDPVGSLALFESTEAVTAPVPQVFDPSRGSRAFAVVQAGQTAMLAGALTRALAYFEKVLACPVPGALAFFHRESHLRSALIHALYGDHETATQHHAAAAGIERTECWPEAGLDAELVVVEALLSPAADADKALKRISAIPVASTGEMWPYHLIAAHTLAIISGNFQRLRTRAAQFENAGLIHAGATGLLGSVLPWMRCSDAISAGDVSRAAADLAQADPQLWQTSLLRSVVEVRRGRPAAAVRLLYGCATQTAPLARAEAERLAVLALARHAEQDSAAVDHVLIALAPNLTAYSGRLLEVLSPPLAVRASAHVERWPVAALREPGADVEGVLEIEALRERELDVLRELAQGRTRGEIAERLYLSINTIKTHQRSLYRKLRVTSKADALQVARHRGLI